MKTLGRFKLGRLKMALGLGLVALLAGMIGCNKSSNSTAPLDELAAQVTDESSDGIFGGTKVVPQDIVAKSTVGIVDLTRGVICTGSLIANDIVLTAAHCVTPNPMAILFSTRVPQNSSEWQAAPLRLVSVAKLNELYSQVKRGQVDNWGDVALLKFNGTLPTGYHVAQMIRDSSSLRTGQIVTLAGFGLIDGIRRIDTDSLRKTNVKLANPKFSNLEVSLDQTQGRGACHGDSGGPAFVRVGKQLLLMGVTSRGHLDPMDTCQNYAIYSNVASFTEWIQKSIAQIRQVPNRQQTQQSSAQ